MPEPRLDLLVDTDWLESRLGNPDIHIFDCTLKRVPQPSGASVWESGLANWQDTHIPGAGYLHMVDDLSEPTGTIPYGVPGRERIAALMSSFGITDDTTLVLYGDGGQSVVHRVWWVLKASGLGDVRILDGGWRRWCAEGRPVDAGIPAFRPTEFAPEPRPEFLVGRDDVVRALGNPAVCLIHSLTEDQFCGVGGQIYGRPGRIPGSVNVPAHTLFDAQTTRMRPIEELSAIFSAVGADTSETIIPYCGGGIAASTVFFALALAGYDNVRLYDGSLLDWTSDATLPMTTDAEEAGRVGL